MGIFDGCLFISDVDGTFVNSQFIPQKNIEAAEIIIKEGGMFTFATGRCADGIAEVLSKTKTNAPLALTNGTVLYDYEKKQVLRSIGIDEDTKKILWEVIKNLPHYVGVEVHIGDKLVNFNVTREIELHNLYENLYPIKLSDDEVLIREWNKVLFTFDIDGAQQDFRDYLQSKGIRKEQLTFTNAYLADGIHNYVEVVPNGANKGTAVGWYMELFGIKRENVFCIGDYYNDIPLLKAGGVSAVTAEAPNDVAKSADFISCSVKDGALYKFIEYLRERKQSK